MIHLFRPVIMETTWLAIMAMMDGMSLAIWMYVSIDSFRLKSANKFDFSIFYRFIPLQTSQDPSSPLANMPSTSLPLATTTSNLSAQRNDPRDEWSWNDWGSLEEQPVSETFNFNENHKQLQICKFLPHLSFLIQNEEDRDESEEKEKDLHQITSMNNSKFGMNETMIDDKQVKTIDQNNRPSDLPSLSSNHIITSPTNSNSNSTGVWNTDSWADGEFEPIDSNAGDCQCTSTFWCFYCLVYLFILFHIYCVCVRFNLY